MTDHAAPPTPPAPAAARRAAGPLQRAWALLVSPKLAISLLVAVLACCLAGVTLVRGARAWELIFSTLWFNGLLVLLAISSGAAFFSRIWRRKPSLVSVGMILFHVSFLSLLGGVVFNGLFHFNGVLRLTEGETLPNGSPASYDSIEMGRFFDVSRLRGETTLVELHTGYKVEGEDKRAAYELTVGEPGRQKTEVIWITKNLEHEGVRYLCAKEGYSIGVVLYGADGEERYAGMVPLQSLQSGNGRFYTTGTATAPGAFAFPAPPERPSFALQVAYAPKGGLGREGEVTFQVAPLDAGDRPGPALTGKVQVGESVKLGEHRLEASEVRYWVGINVRYDPGLPVILTSLWAALAGVTMTFVGRILQDSRRPARGEAATPPQPPDQEGSP